MPPRTSKLLEQDWLSIIGGAPEPKPKPQPQPQPQPSTASSSRTASAPAHARTASSRDIIIIPDSPSPPKRKRARSDQELVDLYGRPGSASALASTSASVYASKAAVAAPPKRKRARTDQEFEDLCGLSSSEPVPTFASTSGSAYASAKVAASGSKRKRARPEPELEDLYGLPPTYNAPASASGSAYAPAAAAATPPPKKTRKKKNPDAPEVEKRGAIFKKSCPKNILDRVDRVMDQRFYMVDRTRVGEELREEFKVLGSTGNVYTVIIDKKPSCNCPDASKGNHCKHILFIFLKVLQVTQASGFWYQKALLTSELAVIFAEAPLAPNAQANARIREAYAQATGKAGPSKAKDNGKKKRVPTAEDDCPICYEGMHGAPEVKLAWCDGCGNMVHKECFQQWARTKPNATCVFCRAPWPAAGGAGGGRGGGGAARTAGGYVNLAGVAGVSPVRDTSSYYHGPRRGQRHYGYQDYDD